MSDRIKATLIEEASRIKSSAADAARSGTYIYPLKGILYFSTHHSLWRPFLSRFWQTITIGVGVTTTMFMLTYVPQTALLTFTSGPLAPISAALLVLSESSTITTFLARSFLPDSLVDTFDGTLVARGHEPLVAQGRRLDDRVRDPVTRLGRVLTRPWTKFRPQTLLRSLVYLPLNLIPVVGTVMYVVVQGRKVGPLAHARYFQLKGWGEREREEWLRKNHIAYTSFGVMAFFLEMVPFASMAFSFTNTVGAALWASDIEKANNSARKE